MMTAVLLLAASTPAYVPAASLLSVGRGRSLAMASPEQEPDTSCVASVTPYVDVEEAADAISDMFLSDIKPEDIVDDISRSMSPEPTYRKSKPDVTDGVASVLYNIEAFGEAAAEAIEAAKAFEAEHDLVDRARGTVGAVNEFAEKNELGLRARAVFELLFEAAKPAVAAAAEGIATKSKKLQPTPEPEIEPELELDPESKKTPFKFEI